jgi:hypothetical protein
MWHSLTRVPSFFLTFLILIWLIAMQVSSNAVWIVGVSFLLTIILALFTLAFLKVYPARKFKEPSPFRRIVEASWLPHFLVIVEGLLLLLVMGVFPAHEYSLLPGWLLFLTVFPLPLAALQYHFVTRRAYRERNIR